MDHKEWGFLFFKAYLLLYFNGLNSFQTKKQVELIRNIVGDYLYLVQSKSYYGDTGRAARIKIKYYLDQNEISKEELNHLLFDMRRLVFETNFIGKRQRKFLSIFDSVAEKNEIQIASIFE